MEWITFVEIEKENNLFFLKNSQKLPTCADKLCSCLSGWKIIYSFFVKLKMKIWFAVQCAKMNKKADEQQQHR